MASGSASNAPLYLADGFSQNRPPRFEGVNYGYWKNRMELFVGSTDPKLWARVIKGPHELKEDQEKWSDEDFEKFQQNCKATNLMYCALGPEEYHKVAGCKTAKEIWDKLQVTYEGTSQVKTSRINSLKHQFELFKMEEGESIRMMYERFTNIVNSLENPGKSYESGDLVRKIMWSLPEKWTPKITAIEEAKDLEKLSVDELIGSLVAHEDKLNKAGQEKEVLDKGKRGVAFRAITLLEDSEELDDMEDEELALLSKQVSRLLKIRREKKYGNSGSKAKEFERNDNGVKGNQLRSFSRGRTDVGQNNRSVNTTGCFKCGRTGHIKAECPQLKKERALAATWSCSEDEMDEDDEVVVQRSFMAIADLEDEPLEPNSNLRQVSDTESMHESENLSENELLIDTIRDIEVEFGNVKMRYSKMKRENLEYLTRIA
ncbi:unnamed protein product [Linum trigynum]|uniref:CCHC-type domain-containing protein n=1 Tax=Linum trigynum TaxID=586398 RepID=A0AAV2EZN6_9ROSI